MRYLGTYHASVYFAFNFNYITSATTRAAVLGRVLNWLGTATTVVGKDDADGEKTPEIPDRFTLSQNYPNPFNPVTAIQVGVPANFSGAAELSIYNVKGELVKTLHEGAIKPGTHVYRWDGTNNYGRKVTSGIYFYRFICGTERMTKKMVLLR
jgi:hypothetical protein